MDLYAIKKRLADATPGPWNLSGDKNTITQTSHITRDVWTIPRTQEDMVLIASAPEDLSSLIREIERLREELDRTEHARSSIDTAIMLEVQKERAAIVRYLNLVYGANVAAQEIERGDHHQGKE